MLISLLFIVIGFIVILISVMIYYSPGKPEPIFGSNGEIIPNSISEKVFVKIGGIRQGMFIRSNDINKPVLLYLHGGPSFPNYFLFDKYKPGLEEFFTVCYWEQRGGGLSYTPDLPLETMTFDQLTSDAIEVTNYLRKRFKQDKIYLMAHSGGTVIGIKAVTKSPELYKAYIAMAQVTNQAQSEKIAYQYIYDKYKAIGNTKALTELQKYNILDNETSCISFFKSPIRDNAMHELGIGTMRNMRSVMSGVFIPSLKCKAYSLKEKYYMWSSKFSFVKKAKFINELFQLDIPTMFPKLDIPVYFMSGKYDMTVNVDLTKAYLNQLQAPVKGFYLFEDSAHSPLFEEPIRFKEIIRNDILKEKTGLTDKIE